MSKIVTCRVCGRQIRFMGWNKHVESHKKEFCNKFNVPKTLWWKVKWETVVETLNPSQAKKPKRVAAQPIKHHGQKTLNQIWRENK